MMPPPSAVIMPRVTTPTMSTCAARTAVNAPFNANANVPARSRTNSTGGFSGHSKGLPHRPPKLRSAVVRTALHPGASHAMPATRAASASYPASTCTA